MGTEAYIGARLVSCCDAGLKSCADCPHDGCRGKLYDTKQPAIFIRLTGRPLVGATRFEQEVLRCSACQERFTTPLPIGVKPEKYDETCYVSLALALSDSGSQSDYVLTFTGYRLPPSASFILMEVEWSL